MKQMDNLKAHPFSEIRMYVYDTFLRERCSLQMYWMFFYWLEKGVDAISSISPWPRLWHHQGLIFLLAREGGGGLFASQETLPNIRTSVIMYIIHAVSLSFNSCGCFSAELKWNWHNIYLGTLCNFLLVKNGYFFIQEIGRILNIM